MSLASHSARASENTSNTRTGRETNKQLGIDSNSCVIDVGVRTPGASFLFSVNPRVGRFKLVTPYNVSLLRVVVQKK